MDLTGKTQLLLFNFIPLITLSDFKIFKYTIFFTLLHQQLENKSLQVKEWKARWKTRFFLLNKILKQISNHIISHFTEVKFSKILKLFVLMLHTKELGEKY